METEKLFLNRRYIPNIEGKYTMYVNRNGVLKKVIPTPLTKKLLRSLDVWYCLEDLPIDLQNKYRDMAITAKDIALGANKKQNKNNILDREDISIYVTETTPILPIVGNLLPSDGTNAYTVVFNDGKPSLKPIIVCWGCHWSELFTGQTSYGTNVFCLASDLTEEQRNLFVDDIILLKDATKFLENPYNEPEKKI